MTAWRRLRGRVAVEAIDPVQSFVFKSGSDLLRLSRGFASLLLIKPSSHKDRLARRLRHDLELRPDTASLPSWVVWARDRREAPDGLFLP